MLNNLKEINRILLGVNDLSTDKGALTKNVIDYCGEIVLEGSIVNHETTVDFCLSIGLLRRKQEYIQISEVGKEFISYNTEKNFSLSPKQKNFLSRECFLKGPLSKDVRAVLNQFKPDYRKKTFSWSKTDGFPLEADRDLLNLLIQSEVLFRSNDLFIINPEYAYLVSAFKTSSRIMTDEELKESLEVRNMVGKIAENIVVEFEKNRLASEGHKAESEMVQSISDIDVGAGYDVISFNGNSDTFDHDRFIEVKGSVGKDMSFLISNNEIKIAKELGPKYWIYFVREIDVNTKSSRIQPQIFQNPAVTILENDDFDKDCVRVWIRQNSKKKEILE